MAICSLTNPKVLSTQAGRVMTIGSIRTTEIPTHGRTMVSRVEQLKQDLAVKRGNTMVEFALARPL